MQHVFVNVVLTAIVVGLAAWLSDRWPGKAGFLVSLPLSTMLVLPLAHRQGGDIENTAAFARSILIAVPITLTFLVPFALAPRWGLSFGKAYAIGLAFLAAGFLVHHVLFRLLGRIA